MRRILVDSHRETKLLVGPQRLEGLVEARLDSKARRLRVLRRSQLAQLGQSRLAIPLQVNFDRLVDIVKRVSEIMSYKTTTYVGKVRILDLEAAGSEDKPTVADPESDVSGT